MYVLRSSGLICHSKTLLINFMFDVKFVDKESRQRKCDKGINPCDYQPDQCISINPGSFLAKYF